MPILIVVGTNEYIASWLAWKPAVFFVVLCKTAVSVIDGGILVKLSKDLPGLYVGFVRSIFSRCA